MVPPSTAPDTTQSNDGGRVKKTRKRPNTGSCIPCSKRRQKCDRTQPCSSCISRRAPHLCKWEPIYDVPSPSWSPQDTATADGIMEEGDVNEDEIPPALRTTKLDLNENREMLEILTKRIQSLENRVVSTAGPASAPAAVGSSKPSVPLDTASGGGVGYGKVEGMYQPGPLTGMSPGTGLGGMSGVVGGYDYSVASAPKLTESIPLHDVSSRASIASPPMQSPRAHIPARPQASRRQSDISFGVPSAPRDDPLTQLIPFSLVHPGEFVGRVNASGTVHLIHSSSPFRLPHAESTAPTSVLSSYVTPLVQTLIPAATVQHLIQYLPDMQSGNLLIDTFLKEVNWRYGLPEKWLSNACFQMWTSLQNPPQSHKLNPYWLSLFFSILACTPRLPGGSSSNTRLHNTYDSDTYYLCASTARRMAEDDYFSSSNTTLIGGSSPVDGCVFGCLSIPLLCDFLATRGRVSEAWKLMGVGIRDAQSIGLHRDPDSPVWREMLEEEKDIRRRAWWGLYIWDRLLSYILGRPQMIHRVDCDAAKPSIVDAKGRKDAFLLSRFVMIQLADFVSEVLDKCAGVTYATWTDLAEIDSKFETWETGIPAELRPGTTQEQDIIAFAGLSPSEVHIFNRHRYMITTWCFLARLKFYILVIECHQLRTPLSTGLRIESPGPLPERIAEKCARLALELIKFQCDTFERMRRPKLGERWLAENWYFEGCLSLFEAALALLLTLTKYPTMVVPPGSATAEMGLKLEYEEMTRVISRVVNTFSQVITIEKDANNRSGETKHEMRAETASKALGVLQALFKEHWQKLDPRTDQGRLLQGSSARSSPRRAESNEAAGLAGSGSGLPYGGTVYGGSPNTGSPYTPQQHTQTPVRHQTRQKSPIQAYSGLVSPASAEGKSFSTVQQSHQFQVQPNMYGSTEQYPTMMTDSYSTSSIPQPPFENLPLPARGTSYPQYSINNQTPSAPTVTEPSKTIHSSPYDYQPQNFFSSVDVPPSYSFPFTLTTSQSSSQNSDRDQGNLYQHQHQPRQDQSQQQAYLREPQQYQSPLNPIPSPTQLSPLQPNTAASAFAYNPPAPMVTSVPSSSAGGRPPVRTVRSSPGIPPPSQGIKMIHYVAPGSTTTSTTTASGMGSGMTFSVSGMSQNTTSQGPPPSQQNQTRPQGSRMVLTDFMSGPPPSSGN